MAMAMAPIRGGAPRPELDFMSQPSPVELLETYLRSRVVSGKSGSFIHDADVYGATPNDLASAYSPATAGDGSVAWYFLTPLQAKKGRGHRTKRAVLSSGWSWHQERRAKAILSSAYSPSLVLTNN